MEKNKMEAACGEVVGVLPFEKDKVACIVDKILTIFIGLFLTAIMPRINPRQRFVAENGRNLVHYRITFKLTAMKITIQAKGFTAREELLAFAREKVVKLYNLYDKIIECEIILTLANASDRKNKAAQIKLGVPGNDMLASAQSKTFEESLMLAIEGLERQIEKRKTQETTYN